MWLHGSKSFELPCKCGSVSWTKYLRFAHITRSNVTKINNLRSTATDDIWFRERFVQRWSWTHSTTRRAETHWLWQYMLIDGCLHKKKHTVSLGLYVQNIYQEKDSTSFKVIDLTSPGRWRRRDEGSMGRSVISSALWLLQLPKWMCVCVTVRLLLTGELTSYRHLTPSATVAHKWAPIKVSWRTGTKLTSNEFRAPGKERSKGNPRSARTSQVYREGTERLRELYYVDMPVHVTVSVVR